MVIYFNIPVRWRIYLLLIANYIFYLSFNPRYIIFILTTTIVSYSSAYIMNFTQSEKVKKCALVFALVVELILLGMTKYWNPIMESTGWLSPIKILIPLGISFYTFQTIGYLFDVYRENLKAELSFPKYAMFLSFFPHLLAGPIEPAQHFLPQLSETMKFEYKRLAFAILLILVGLFKKLVIADRLGPVVNLVFDAPKDHHGLAIVMATILARYQIYCDFSGYTDIALGSAMMFGYKLTLNFNRPFFAKSISEYWRRWHISLSQWIRDYVFYPLLSTPFSILGANGLVLLTFFILGLWHGGTINFLFYGLTQGILIIIDSKTKSLRTRFYHKMGLNNFPKILNATAISFTFFFLVVPPTLLFRATHFSDTKILLSNLTNQSWSRIDLAFLFKSEYLLESLIIALVGIFLLELMDWIQKTQFDLAEYIYSKPKSLLIFIITALLFSILIFGMIEDHTQFIYTRF